MGVNQVGMIRDAWHFDDQENVEETCRPGYEYDMGGNRCQSALITTSYWLL